MKKVLSLCLVLVFIFTTMSTQVFAAVDAKDSGITISSEGGKEIELYGHIESTIISVTMPSYIPFDISRSVETQNKAVSPKITVQNNSKVPVTVLVDRARVDLNHLPNVTWSSNGTVGEKQIAIGFVPSKEQPAELTGARWIENGIQDTKLLDLPISTADTMFIVGALGSQVPENKTFSVIPTLIVRPAV